MKDRILKHLIFVPVLVFAFVMGAVVILEFAWWKLIAFLALKGNHAFWGTDWEFIVHSATIDGIPLVWIIFILFILEIILIVRTIFISSKKHC